MAYSTVFDKPLKSARRTENPTIDGESVIQELGFIETKAYRFHWITTAELQGKVLEWQGGYGVVSFGTGDLQCSFSTA